MTSVFQKYLRNYVVGINCLYTAMVILMNMNIRRNYHPMTNEIKLETENISPMNNEPDATNMIVICKALGGDSNGILAQQQKTKTIKNNDCYPQQNSQTHGCYPQQNSQTHGQYVVVNMYILLILVIVIHGVNKIIMNQLVIVL